MTDEELYWIGFSVFPGIGPVRFDLLHTFFGSAKSAWRATRKSLIETHLPIHLVDEFCSFRTSFSLTSYKDELQQLHVFALTKNHAHYPSLLKEISDAPIVLYVKGKKGTTLINMDKTIAVVGTRHPTNYGITVAKQIVADLVAAGCTIVSGMAYGIDAVSHETAIACGGKTIAVLGCGVDICAPFANRHIYQKLTDERFGAVVSEMPLGLRPNKGLFPARNRIISGLSRGVLVVEGAEDSGTLITASNAATQGRDVFAVPGTIMSKMSKGPAILLKAGAILVESAHDILEHV
ncbi:MAG: DNA-processing protein DprA [Candidatus Gottesmanbacteria bacterium]